MSNKWFVSPYKINCHNNPTYEILFGFSFWFVFVKLILKQATNHAQNP